MWFHLRKIKYLIPKGKVSIVHVKLWINGSICVHLRAKKCAFLLLHYRSLLNFYCFTVMKHVQRIREWEFLTKAHVFFRTFSCALVFAGLRLAYTKQWCEPWSIALVCSFLCLMISRLISQKIFSIVVVRVDRTSFGLITRDSIEYHLILRKGLCILWSLFTCIKTEPDFVFITCVIKNAKKWYHYKLQDLKILIGNKKMWITLLI